MTSRIKIHNLPELYELISEEERIMVDILREMVLQQLPSYGIEKISYNVPFFKGKRSICMIWPASIPRGGIVEGVLLGFWYGNRLKDEESFLDRGTNKQIFYRIFKRAEEMDFEGITKILREAIRFDSTF